MDNLKLWNKFLETIKPELSPANFRTFFSTSSIYSVSDDNITIAVYSAFTFSTLNQRHKPLMESTFEKILGKPVKVALIVKQNGVVSKEEEIFQVAPTPSAYYLNQKFTLESFVVGPSNNVAFAAAQAVVQNPGLSYNPLFIYGGTGVGKTHLMVGIGQAILQKDPKAKVIYCSSEQFTNDYVAALQNRKMADFRRKYRLAQLLLIDDIQFFSGREGMQEEFFHTFNDLQSKNSQMVITSDKAPHEIAKLEERLRSRFAGGLMVDIQIPDFDTRLAILRAKSSQWGAIFPEESLKLIASSNELSIRELEGKLLQIIQTLKANNLEALPENITPHLTIAPKKPLSLTHNQVFSAICSYFNISNKDLTGPKRQKGLVLPRHIAMFILSEELGWTVERIGQVLGGRDHTTVMHGRDKIKELIRNDREIEKAFTEVKNNLSTA